MTVATTLPVPGDTGMNVVELPEAGEKRPSVLDQAGATATALPYASAAEAVNTTAFPTGTFAEAGLTLSVATAPAVTVSVCVALVRPGALAVIVGAPAFRSR